MTDDLNLRYLEKEWLSGQRSGCAVRRMQRFSDEKLNILLRHHDETEEGISIRETWLRDDVDYLLSFYSIVEIATMIGFVPGLPWRFTRKHFPILNRPGLRRYYEWNYPLDLPRRLRERMLSRSGYLTPGDDKITAAFYEFLQLTKVIERDKDLESFLWCLDGGYREDKGGRSDLDAVSVALTKPNRLAQATQRPPTKRRELDRALNGFCKFIQFCDELDALIRRLRDTPELADAIWSSYAYWFRQLQAKMGCDLRDAVRGLAKWNVGENDKQALRERVAEINDTLQRLSLPPTSRWKMLSHLQAGARNSFLGTFIQRDDIKQLETEQVIEFDETPAGVSVEDMKFREPLNMSVNNIELSVRAANGLNNANINTVGQLIQKREDELLKYRNFNIRTIEEIKSKLKEMGLGLGMTAPSEVADFPVVEHSEGAEV